MSFLPDPGQPPLNAAAGLVSAQAIDAAKAETAKLVDAAKSGGFTVTPEAVGDMRKALADMQTSLATLMQQTATLSQAPKLGGHPYGHTVAAHVQKGATETTGSATAALQQFSDVLTAADEALARAAGVYQETEQGAADAAKGAGA
jgi:hypothetical protein